MAKKAAVYKIGCPVTFGKANAENTELVAYAGRMQVVRVNCDKPYFMVGDTGPFGETFVWSGFLVRVTGIKTEKLACEVAWALNDAYETATTEAFFEGVNAGVEVATGG